MREPNITPPGYSEPGILTTAHSYDWREEEAREAAGHALYDACYKLSEACDQNLRTYRETDPAAMDSLRNRVNELLDEAFVLFGVPQWKR